MRLIAPHLARPALSQTLARYISCGKTLPFVAHTPFLIPRRLFSARLPTDFDLDLDDEMGKEDKSGKNFNLKVPKGTRDCEFGIPFSSSLGQPYGTATHCARDW